MRITHVVTYVSGDGAFGGPTAVAVTQLEDLLVQGYSVGLLAGHDGSAFLRTDVGCAFFRARRVGRGFRFIFAPGLYLDVLRLRRDSNVLHIHLGRDFVTMLVALIAMAKKIPFVVQTHGMIRPRRSAFHRVFDFVATKRVLNAAARVYVLTKQEYADISRISRGRAEIDVLPNGIGQSGRAESGDRNDNLVMFLARLHPRKRVTTFIEMCQVLRDRGVEFQAEVFGPDEGDLAGMFEAIDRYDLSRVVRYSGTIGQGEAIDVLSHAGAYVLPSIGEVFPMTVLESLAAGTPVVTTTQSGLAQALAELDAAEVTDGSAEGLADAVEGILRSPLRGTELRSNGIAAIESHFGIRAVTERLGTHYGELSVQK